jgi:hypothetical protein
LHQSHLVRFKTWPLMQHLTHPSFPGYCQISQTNF